MDLSYIHQQLKNINLNIDLQTIQDVQNFLINQIGFINQIQLDYQIYAALAIVSETKTLPNVALSGYSKIGIKIENVMSHLGKLSKQKFLDTLNKQLQKLKKAPQNMKKRVQDIRFSYRFYKKYQTTFQALFQKLLPRRSSQQQFSALFWVLFLFIKNEHIETQNITEAKSLLILIFRMIFQNFISQTSFTDIFSILEENIGAIPQISMQKHDFYLSKLSQKIDFFYKQRFHDQHANFNKLIENYTYLDRLVDDMSTEYAKNRMNLKYYNETDELSYLELKKNLTPQVLRNFASVEMTQLVISQQLSFDDSDEQIENEKQQPSQQTPLKKPNLVGDKDFVQTPQNQFVPLITVSPRTPTWKGVISLPTFSQSLLFQDKAQSTPISKKINNQKWMNARISSVTSQKQNQIMKMFDQLDHNMEEMEQSSRLSIFIKQKIYKLIKQFTPKCQDYQQRYEKMFSFFIQNFLEITNGNQQFLSKNQNEGSKIREILIGIGALSFQIFNYINNSISYEFKHHYEVFGISISVAVESFELFQSFLINNMPIDLKKYIENSKKRFMVSDIWQNQSGFKLLFSSQNDPKLNKLKQKIHSFTRKRIQEICHQARIESKIITKTINIMKIILDQKSYLLKKNNIDQIILCCIMSCLSINEKHQQQSLQNLFQSYNSNIQFAFNSNQLGLRDHQGNQMKILDYYNEVFLQEIQDLLTENQTQLDDFLLTPVRISKSFNINNIDKNINKMKQVPLAGNFLFNPQKSSLGRNSYRKQMFKQARQNQMKQQKQQNQQDPPSPTFGITKHFSFGPGPSNN